MTVYRQAKVYDVCIVGSGAGGGMAAYMLTKAGAEVVVLEAGGPWDNAKDSAMLTWPYESPRRGKSTTNRPFGEFDACIGGWEIPGEPYTRAPGTEFAWWRARMVGGRTNHWGRISLRFGPYDFKRKSRDGLGDDWPISYDDGARGAGGFAGSRHGRRVRRQDDRGGRPSPGQSGGPGRERPGDRPPAAQLQVVPVPQRPGELERHRRQVHHRYDRHGRRRVHPEDDGPRPAQPRRRGRHAPVHAVVARQREARLPARLPHRGVGRHPGAVLRLLGRD